MLKLEPFTSKDISTLLKWLEGTDNRFLFQFAGSKYQFPLSEKQLIETIDSDDYIPLKLIDLVNNKILGHCQFLRVNHVESSASIGRLLINPEYRNKGFGTIMLKEMISYSKNVLIVKKLELRVFEFNKNALKCYSKIGFTIKSEELIYIKEFNVSWKCITMVKV
ncbi:MAG: GNAT family N-acetyltransferase [Spirochaetales bacterium]|nr:GNAT family N-acetyltransferase [Spirochaetales bacterium]